MTMENCGVLTVSQHSSSSVDVCRIAALKSKLHQTAWEVDPQSILLIVMIASVETIIREGSYVVYDGDLSSGTILVCNSGAACTAKFSGKFELVSIRLKMAALHGSFNISREGSQSWRSVEILPRDPLVEQLARSMISAAEQCDEAYAFAVSNVIACRAARSSGIAARTGQLPKWRLKRVQSFIENRIEKSLTLADLAAAADLSRMHFAAQFRATTGVRPHEYVLLRRVERSKALMLQTDEPLAQVALACGFQAQSHFSTTFKRFTGETPAVWRREARARDRTATSYLSQRAAVAALA
ncbi:MAG TPA: AraC family transcriptional regulator [Fimbriimonadaceae bacterium]|nr:AraC family transcriptional regulator [Fimbriimonadaceae bacterium]